MITARVTVRLTVRVTVRVTVMKLYLFDQDEAAMSEGKGPEETEREQEKLGIRGRRKSGPLRRGHSGCWRGRRGGMSGTGGAAEVVEAGVHSWVVVTVRARVTVRISVQWDTYFHKQTQHKPNGWLLNNQLRIARLRLGLGLGSITS